MEYPGSHFTRPVRLALLIFFFILFFSISPIIIFYTAGYRLDLTYGVIRETGSLSIDEIIPKNTVVYVNGLKASTSLPLRLKSLTTPGTYTVLLTAPGYFDWQKQVDIASKQTVYIKQIRLLKKETPTLVSDGIIKDLSLSPSGNYLLYTKRTSTTKQIWWHDTTAEKNQLLTDWPMPDAKLSWAEKNDYLVLSSSHAPFTHLFIVNATQPGQEFVNLTKISPAPIQKFIWDTTNEPRLYFSTDKNLFSYFPKTNKLISIATNTWIDWTATDGMFWGLAINTSTNQYKIVKDIFGFAADFKAIDTLNGITSSTYKKFPVELLAARRDTVLIKDGTQSKMYLLTKNNSFTFSGDQLLISPHNNWWLFWTPWEIWSYAEGDTPNLLNRSGEQLQKIEPLDEYNTLALVWPTKTTALFPYYLLSHTLLSKSVTDLVADSSRHILYYSEQKNNKGSLWKLNY